MARTRLSCLMLAPELGIAHQQISKWRTGTRPIPAHHLLRLEELFRARGAADRVPPRVDPAAIPPAPISRRISVAQHKPEPALAKGPAPAKAGAEAKAEAAEAPTSFFTALNRLLAPLTQMAPTATTPDRPRSSTSQARPAPRTLPPAIAPQAHAVLTVAAPTPASPPLSRGQARCAWAGTGPLNPPCGQLAAPGSRYCAEHVVAVYRRT
ncbi:MAG: hypothetical protein WB679_05360 [Terracidiphilus sp.]